MLINCDGFVWMRWALSRQILRRPLARLARAALGGFLWAGLIVGPRFAVGQQVLGPDFAGVGTVPPAVQGLGKWYAGVDAPVAGLPDRVEMKLRVPGFPLGAKKLANRPDWTPNRDRQTLQFVSGLWTADRKTGVVAIMQWGDDRACGRRPCWRVVPGTVSNGQLTTGDAAVVQAFWYAQAEFVRTEQGWSVKISASQRGAQSKATNNPRVSTKLEGAPPAAYAIVQRIGLAVERLDQCRNLSSSGIDSVSTTVPVTATVFVAPPETRHQDCLLDAWGTPEGKGTLEFVNPTTIHHNPSPPFHLKRPRDRFL